MAITKATQNVITPNIVTTDTTQTITGAKTFSSIDGGVLATGTDTVRTLASRFGEVINVKDFGATGDGTTNDFPFIQAAINYYVQNAPIRPKLYFPAGTYLINSTTNSLSGTNLGALYIKSPSATDRYSYQIEFHQNAVIKAGTGLKESMDAKGATGTQALIYVESDFSTSTYNFVDDNYPEFNLTGGIFDISNFSIATTYGVNCLSIGPKFGAVRISNTTFTHGLGPASGATINPSGRGDSSITCAEPEFVSITNCKFMGAVDLGVYLTGTGGDTSLPDTSLRVGRHAIVSGNYFYRCNSAIACKRWFEKTIISGNNIFECGDGIFAGVADGNTINTGQKITVSNNIINKCQGNPLRLTSSDFAVVSNNQILDYRKLISDETIATTVSNSNYGAAILLEGSSNFSVTGNVVGFDKWTPSLTVYKWDSGIRIDYYKPSTVPGKFTVGLQYQIITVGSTTQLEWNTIAGTTGVTYSVGSIFTCVNVGTSALTPAGTAQVTIPYLSNNGIVIGNQIENCYKPIIELNGCSDNIFNDNSISNCTTNYNDTITDEDRTNYIAGTQSGFKYFGGLNPDYSIFSAIAANTEVARFTATTSAVNNVVFQNSIAASPVVITARGSDPAVDLQLLPKGIGAIRLQGWTSIGGGAVNGYFTVKDASGNVKKIPTIA